MTVAEAARLRRGLVIVAVVLLVLLLWADGGGWFAPEWDF